MGLISDVISLKKNLDEVKTTLFTPEELSVISYFSKGGGCLSKNITDEAYETIIRNRINSGNFKQTAMDKIELDESQLKEISPVYFEGYIFDAKKGAVKAGKDHVWRSSIYQISWLFFSDTEVHVYQYTFNLDDHEGKEETKEYLYKDITSFSISSDTVERPVLVEKGGCLGKKIKKVRKTIDVEKFALTVSGGEKFYCSLTKKNDTEGIIQAMKAKLSEKKL